MKSIVLSLAALCVLASPADAAQKKHRNHRTEKAVATGAAVGGVVGATVGAPVQGAAAGAAIGVAVAEMTKNNVKQYRGYRYWKGHYYRAGKRYAPAQMSSRRYLSRKYPGYVYWNGFYYRKNKRFSPAQMRGER
jgi:hypothetical protein